MGLKVCHGLEFTLPKVVNHGQYRSWSPGGTKDLHDGRGAYVKPFTHSCGRAECPVCYESWAALEAHRAMRRLQAAHVRKPIHVMVSPRLSDWKLPYHVVRSRAYQIAKRCGVKGGLLTFHLYRDEATGGELYESPHFHVEGYGWIQGTKEEYEHSGYVVKNLGVRKDPYRTLQYLLSHAGVWMEGTGEEGESTGILPIAKSKVHTVTWFGTLSYAKLHVEKEEFTDTCPICGHDFVIVDWKSLGDPPEEGFIRPELLPEVVA